MDYYYYAGFIAEFLAAISATIFFYKYKNTKLLWLLPLLWYIPINELLCQYAFARTETGYLLLNIYRILVPFSIIFLILSQVRNKRTKYFIHSIVGFLAVSYIIEFFYINPLKSFIDVSFTIASILIILALLSYFIEELSENYVNQVNKNLFVWICFGFLIFHIPFPVISLVQRNITNYSNEIVTALYKIHIILACISYFVIAFGFYWGDTIASQSNANNEQNE